MKKSSKVALIFAFLVSIFVPVAAFADEIGDVVAPTGIMALVVIIPLIVVLVLLFMKVDMIIAGLIGGVLAMLIGGIGLEEANKQMLEAIPMMLGITVPIINSAVAMAVFKAGSYSAALTLAKRGTKGKVEYVSAFIVILLAAATYMSGIGGGSAMVIAPLAFAAVGVVPELIAAMSLAAAVSFTTSPASLESSIVSKLGDISVGSYVSTIFLAFINVIAQTGTFAVIAGVAENAPAFIVVPVAILTGILIGIPAGAYVGSVLTLVLPVAVSLNFPPLALGFVAMGVGLGSQMSFVNITMQALSSGFQIPILDVVKGNVKWLSIASVLLLVIGLIFG